MDKSMTTLGWGVIGIGRIVSEAIAPAIVAEADCDLVAAVSRDQSRANAFAANFGARFAYTDYDQMLANPEVGAVFIATPNALHAEQIIAAAEAGKNVLCEKPLATNLADALRAVEVCASNGVTLGINFHYRHIPWIQDTKQLIAEGRIGVVQTVQVEASAGRAPPEGWRLDPLLAGLGTIYSHGVHVLDALRFILDSDPIEVMAMFDNEGGRYAVETQALVLLRFRNGTLAYVNCNQCNPHPQNDIAIYGTRGRVRGTDLTRMGRVGQLKVLVAGTETAIPYPNPEAHRSSLASYAKSVLKGDEPVVSGLDGLHSMVLCDSIERSVRERRLVEVEYDEVDRLTGIVPRR